MIGAYCTNNAGEGTVNAYLTMVIFIITLTGKYLILSMDLQKSLPYLNSNDDARSTNALLVLLMQR